jgi:hypothetical protein
MQESMTFISRGLKNYKELSLSSLYISPGIFTIPNLNHVQMVSNDKFSLPYSS